MFWRQRPNSEFPRPREIATKRIMTRGWKRRTQMRAWRRRLVIRDLRNGAIARKTYWHASFIFTVLSTTNGWSILSAAFFSPIAFVMTVMLRVLLVECDGMNALIQNFQIDEDDVFVAVTPFFLSLGGFRAKLQDSRAARTASNNFRKNDSLAVLAIGENMIAFRESPFRK